MDEHACLVVETLTLDAQSLRCGHAVLIIERLGGQVSDWHVAVLDLPLLPAAGAASRGW